MQLSSIRPNVGPLCRYQPPLQQCQHISISAPEIIGVLYGGQFQLVTSPDITYMVSTDFLTILSELTASLPGRKVILSRNERKFELTFLYLPVTFHFKIFYCFPVWNIDMNRFDLFRIIPVTMILCVWYLSYPWPFHIAWWAKNIAFQPAPAWSATTPLLRVVLSPRQCVYYCRRKLSSFPGQHQPGSGTFLQLIQHCQRFLPFL